MLKFTSHHIGGQFRARLCQSWGWEFEQPCPSLCLGACECVLGVEEEECVLLQCDPLLGLKLSTLGGKPRVAPEGA